MGPTPWLSKINLWWRCSIYIFLDLFYRLFYPSLRTPCTWSWFTFTLITTRLLMFKTAPLTAKEKIIKIKFRLAALGYYWVCTLSRFHAVLFMKDITQGFKQRQQLQPHKNKSGMSFIELDSIWQHFLFQFTIVTITTRKIFLQY